ncbi:uridine diphosphate-N-acetylglucosamine-binding protein YvcK [Pseudonocardia sp. KRD-169]|uniref:Putative gluconeogenesis factor n=1 Tax=Pseudonocardia abyssalis TaxID=2792008 RepID=A0ABS6UPY1_9PSEU|nr:uridine diphosphate-N-acetylglucosamine-binding protein YvcK [Pseudonocardia abyssalis]MBW0115933.1 uridine diphosphate-N-acetylglucosamine-binding protein YvcK [Pseudonocardia abyssalis]MBW0134320.1 uridine diphosphate-N-acetylglucosamine-binding protein YvcK [Pseudonocardia abyssalis]
MRAVALGGGHGLHATLSALRVLAARGVVDAHVTAVVTVADDGGSSGRLRRELGSLPPGDLRMAMAALASDDVAGQRWTTLVQHRFGGTGALAGHAVGNLLLAGLMDTLGDPVAALDEVGSLLGVRGRVLPMSREPLDIEAEVTGLGSGGPHRIRGQVAVASTPGRVRRVWLQPQRPRACAEAVAAVGAADLLILGPGSWFTSVLPHLLVPELRDAVLAASARRVVVLNLAPEPGETAGFSPERHLAVLSEHAPALRVDAVVADVAAVPVPDRLHRAASSMLSPGGRVHLAPVAADAVMPRHDPVALADALDAVVAGPQAPHPVSTPPDGQTQHSGGS